MTYLTNEISQFRWRGNGFETSSFLGKTYTESGRTFELENPRLLRVLEFALEERSREQIVEFIESTYDLPTEEASALFESLVEKEFVLPADHDNFTDADEWFEKKWRRALYYHLGTRDLTYAERDVDDLDGTKRTVLASYTEDGQPPDVYPSLPGDPVELPEPEPLPETPLNEVMLRRRTNRKYTGEPISARELSTLLYHAFDPVRDVRDRLESAAGESPLQTQQSHHLTFEVYPVVMRGSDVENGVYQYSIRDHALHPIQVGYFDDGQHADEVVSETIVGQQAISGASLACYFSASFERYQWRYRHSRALRTLFSEIPSHAHRLILVATALGFRNFLTPAQKDEVIDDVIGLDGYREAITYFTGFGV